LTSTWSRPRREPDVCRIGFGIISGVKPCEKQDVNVQKPTSESKKNQEKAAQCQADDSDQNPTERRTRANMIQTDIALRLRPFTSSPQQNPLPEIALSIIDGEG
jgi:hypothetical protein